GVGDQGAALGSRDVAAIADLAATFRVEGRAVEDDLDVLALARFIDALATDDERADGRVRREFRVSRERALQPLLLVELRVELPEPHRVLRELRGRAPPLALRVEELLEAGLVHPDARRGDELAGHLHREAEGVVQPERGVAV